MNDLKLMERVLEIHNDVASWKDLKGVEKAACLRRFESGWLAHWNAGVDIGDICEDMHRMGLTVMPGLVVESIDAVAARMGYHLNDQESIERWRGFGLDYEIDVRVEMWRLRSEE